MWSFMKCLIFFVNFWKWSFYITDDIRYGCAEVGWGCMRSLGLEMTTKDPKLSR